MKLIKNEKYDTNNLKFICWIEENGNKCVPDVVEGYHLDYYFDKNGLYKGPDIHGIEPLFED